jgi:hypothetical protein
MLPVVAAVTSPWARARTCFCSLSRFITSPDTNERPSVTNATPAGKIAFHILFDPVLFLMSRQRSGSVLLTLQLRYYCGHATPLSFYLLEQLARHPQGNIGQVCGIGKEVSGHRKLMRRDNFLLHS